MSNVRPQKSTVSLLNTVNDHSPTSPPASTARFQRTRRLLRRFKLVWTKSVQLFGLVKTIIGTSVTALGLIVVLLNLILPLFEVTCLDQTLSLSRLTKCMADRPAYATDVAFRNRHQGRWVTWEGKQLRLFSKPYAEGVDPPLQVVFDLAQWGPPEPVASSPTAGTLGSAFSSSRRPGTVSCWLTLKSADDAWAYYDAIEARWKQGEQVKVFGRIKEFNQRSFSLDPCVAILQ